MSKILQLFPIKSCPTFSCVDAGGDGLFVLHTDERGHRESFGPFPDAAGAREFADNISQQCDSRVDWETFPLAPDPRNGEVYATELCDCHFEGGQEIQTPAGFGVVHMSRSGGSASIIRGFANMAEAKAGALLEARKRGAVLA